MNPGLKEKKRNRKKWSLVFGFLVLFIIGCSSTQDKAKASETINENAKVSAPEISKNRYRTGEKYLFIENVKRDANKISFNLGWDASWRDAENFDAAWVFLKGRKDGIWQHINVKPQTIRLAKNARNNDAEFVEVPEAVGFFVQRRNQGEGDNRWQIELETSAKGFDEIKVFGLEMVFVPEGGFELGTVKPFSERAVEITRGSGAIPAGAFFKYDEKGKDKFGGVFKVESEKPIKIGKADGSLYWIDPVIPGTNTFTGKPEGILSEKFPKGFGGFYMMKYELTQRQYADFLNLLTPEQQAERDPTKTIQFGRPVSDYRYSLEKKDGKFVAQKPNRAANFISWLDGQAFAAWAGLRHMTELEFEKAARGPEEALFREYVWGVNEHKEKSNMILSRKIMNPNGKIAKSEDGNEIVDGNVHAGMLHYKDRADVCEPGAKFYAYRDYSCEMFSGGDGGLGPLRVGIYGRTSNGDRIRAGASYYGAMELGGNLQEPVVTVGHPTGRRFEGTHGTGILSKKGFATNADWLPINGEYAFAGRGGSWRFHENHARIADRFKGLRTNSNRRASHIGFRGVRSVWK